MLAGGAAAGQALSLVAAPVLTRLYSPEEFGALAVFASLLTIGSQIACLRYEMAIPLAPREQDGIDLLWLALLLAGISGAVTGVAVYGGGEWLVRSTSTPALVPYLWLFPLGLVGIGTYLSLSYWAVRQKAFPRIARTRLTQSVGQNATQLALGVAGAGPFGLLAGHVIGSVAGSASLAVGAVRGAGPQILRPSWHGIRRMAARYRRFPLLAGPAALLNTAGIRITPLLLAATYGPEVVGLLAVAERMTTTPVRLVSGAVAQVYLGEAAANAARPEVLRRLMRATTVRLALIGFLPALALAAGGSYVFALVFGEEWRQAGVFVQILALPIFLDFVVSPVSQFFSILERQDLSLVWSGARVAAVAAAVLVPASLGWRPAAAIGVLSAALSFMFLTQYCLNTYVLWKAAGEAADGPKIKG